MIRMSYLAAICAASIATAAYADPTAGIEPSDEYRLPPPYNEPMPAPIEQRGFLAKIGPRKFIAHSIAAALDAGTTYRCSTVRRTCKEANPALRAIVGRHVSAGEAVAAFGIMEAIYLGGSYALGEATGYDSAATKTFQIGLIGSHGILAGLNLRF